ncbi:MAG: sel1 repeat family protein [Deltaproteobacteria bacterium]|nr:sel1 repeat family protein [Deltaproteobacteria bacterium]
MRNPHYAYTKARQDYRRLAAAGHVFAMRNLGMMYENGTGVPRLPSEAARWYKKGAEKDDPVCLLRLGMLLANGRGVPRDRPAAFAALHRAYTLGETAAGAALARLVDAMDPEEANRAAKDAGLSQKDLEELASLKERPS